ncbi:MAG: ABC transporter permease [Paenibacillaceae bacterium]|nr:ABC transporter permease [Paenibacillaceae bacterium]
MGGLIRNELYKALRLKKLYLLALVALTIEIVAALQGKFGGAPPELRQPEDQGFPILLFEHLPFLFVLMATVFMADSWVEEYRSGAMKLSLLRPVSRIAFLNAKVISFFVCAAVLMGFTLVSAYVVGTIVLGWEGHTAVDETELIAKSGAATLLPVLGFGLLVLFIAVRTGNMVVTVGCSAGLLFASQLLEASSELREYSIVYMMQVLPRNLILRYEGRQVILNLAVIAAYIGVFYTGSVHLFRTKDVLA